MKYLHQRAQKMFAGWTIYTYTFIYRNTMNKYNDNNSPRKAPAGNGVNSENLHGMLWV